MSDTLNYDAKLRLNRNYGCEILIYLFEPILRRFVANEVFLLNYGADWKKNIPSAIIQEMIRIRDGEPIDDSSVDSFFEEVTFLNLKDIIIAGNNFKFAKPFFGELSKQKFIELMDILNSFRRKITHARSSFSEQDLENLIEIVTQLSQGEAATEIGKNISNKSYTNASGVPQDFFEEPECQHNLPPESYDLEGGFVGREKEIRAITKLINSEQDRIITITGAGGVGKSSVALRIAYSFLRDPQNPFEAILWFSAKTSRLTDEGIAKIDPGISSANQLAEDILQIMDSDTARSFRDGKVPFENYKQYLYGEFSIRRCLLVVDNLETIVGDEVLIDFIENIPRPSQILITRLWPILTATFWRIEASERSSLARLSVSPLNSIQTRADWSRPLRTLCGASSLSSDLDWLEPSLH